MDQVWSTSVRDYDAHSVYKSHLIYKSQFKWLLCMTLALTELFHVATFNDKRVGAIPPLQFYPTNPLCLSDGNTTDRELTGDWAVGIHCGHQLTASAGDDTAVGEPCSLKEKLR